MGNVVSAFGEQSRIDEERRELMVGPWRLVPQLNRLVGVDGEHHHLEPKLVNLLLFLAQQPGQVRSKQEIVGGVWESAFVTDSAVTRTVAELRRALGDDAQNPIFIETIPKRGYRLVAEIRWVGDPADEAPAPEAQRRTPFPFWPSAAAVLVAALALTVYAMWPDAPVAPSSREGDSRIRLAVLPFEDLSPSPDDGDDYFADAMTEALITDLAQLRSLRVTSGLSVERYKTHRKPLPEIAEELGVKALVTGSVLRSGDRARFHVQLVDALTDSHLWAEVYDREIGDSLHLQSEVARAIAREIHVSLGTEDRITRRRSVDPRALDLYLRARGRLHGSRKEGPNNAPELFRRALEIDPEFAPAWAGLADYYTKLYVFDHAGAREALPKAKQAAQQALAMDDQLAEAHAAMATTSFFVDWNWDMAERSFRQAIDLDPSQGLTRSKFAAYLVCMSRFEEAIDQSRRAVEIDPLTPMHRTRLGWVYVNAGRYDEAIRVLSEDDPDGSTSRPLYLAWAHTMLGDYGPALRIYRDLDQTDAPSDAIYLATKAWTLAQSGRQAEGEAILRQMRQRRDSQGADSYPVAIAAAGVEGAEAALDELRRSFDDHSANLVFLGSEPFFKSLWQEAEFARMAARLDLPYGS